MPVEGRDLSSRQTQYVVKDLEIGQPINSASVQKLQKALHAKAKARSLIREPDAGDLPVRFDERDVETESGLNHKAPPDERGGNRYVLPKATAPHLDSTKRVIWPAACYFRSTPINGHRLPAPACLKSDLRAA